MPNNIMSRTPSKNKATSPLREARAASVEALLRCDHNIYGSTKPAGQYLFRDLADDLTTERFAPEAIDTAIDDLVREGRARLSVDAENGRISILIARAGKAGGHA